MDSLGNLIWNLPEDNIVFLRNLAKTEKDFDSMRKRGFFPYDWLDRIEKPKLPIEVLKHADLNNKLTLENCSDDCWAYIQQLIKYLGIMTFEGYHDFYLNIDVNGLADVFENFRNIFISSYRLDPCRYVGTPSFGWDTMLFRTKVKLELLKDSDMYQFFERGIRGGQSVIFEK